MLELIYEFESSKKALLNFKQLLLKCYSKSFYEHTNFVKASLHYESSENNFDHSIEKTLFDHKSSKFNAFKTLIYLIIKAYLSSFPEENFFN